MLCLFESRGEFRFVIYVPPWKKPFERSQAHGAIIVYVTHDQSEAWCGGSHRGIKQRPTCAMGNARNCTHAEEPLAGEFIGRGSVLEVEAMRQQLH